MIQMLTTLPLVRMSDCITLTLTGSFGLPVVNIWPEAAPSNVEENVSA